MGLSQYRLAKEIDVPAQRIREIIAGKRAITADKDLRLCKFFGLSSGYWLRAQVSHDTEVAEREMGPTLKRIIPWVANTTHSARQKTPPRLVVEALPRQSPALQNFRSLPGINAVDQYISQRMEPRVGISQPNKFTNEKRPD